MTRLASRLAAAVSAAWGAVSPEPGTTEGAVMAGLVLIAAGLLVAGLPALALIVPGTLMFVVGVLPALPRRR